MHRTSLLLDEDSRQAARELAQRYGCSSAEAIRLAIVRHRDAVLGVPEQTRRERRKVLGRLIKLFDGHDAEAEIARLNRQDEGF